MKLTYKMTAGVLVMLLVAFSGTFLISMQNARHYFAGQLNRNAQETASILATSLTSPVTSHNTGAMRTFLKDVVDKGEASRIVVFVPGQSPMAEVRADTIPNRAPGWFGWLTALPEPVARAEISGAGQAGMRVEVYAQRASAVESLWFHALFLLGWYLVSVIFAVALVHVFVKSLLRPLSRVTAQAHALLNDEYTIQGTLPNTKEFRELTLAMNQMVRRLRGVFQEQSRRVELLRQQAFQDPLTGLGNRRFFLHQMSAILADNDDFVPGHLVFASIDGLGELNQKGGYIQGDKAILEAVEPLNDFGEAMQVACIARVSGSQFAMLVQEQDTAVLLKGCQELRQTLASRLAAIGRCEAFVGAAPWRFLQPAESLLREADAALTAARQSFQGTHVTPAPGKIPGIEVLNASLSHGRVVLYWQKVSDTQRVLHRKVFARLIGEQGEEITAGSLIPLAEQAGLAWKIDFLVLESFSGADPALLEPFALTVSANTVTHSLYREQYLARMAELPAPMRRLIRVEFSESLVLKTPEPARAMMLGLRKLGVGSGIDHAGIHFGSMDYLEDLPLLYVKLHGSLARDMVENESKQIFIHHFVAMAKTLELQVVATQVEEEAQWLVLKGAGITWGQGRYLGGVELMQGIAETVKAD